MIHQMEVGFSDFAAFHSLNLTTPIRLIPFPPKARIGCGGRASGRCVFWSILGRWLGSL